MYIPKDFRTDDKETIYEIIEQNGFASLFSQHNGRPYATHLPLILDREQSVLYGHFARPNGQWKDVGDQEVLAVFQGPHCYISSSWYETNKSVPTWNYVAVHVYGQLEVINNEQNLMAYLQDLVNKYEKPNSPYQLHQVEPSYIEGLCKGIVGFKIKIHQTECVCKLSQNSPIERQGLIIQNLEQTTTEDHRKIASLMKENLKNTIYPPHADEKEITDSPSKPSKENRKS